MMMNTEAEKESTLREIAEEVVSLLDETAKMTDELLGIEYASKDAECAPEPAGRIPSLEDTMATIRSKARKNRNGVQIILRKV